MFKLLFTGEDGPPEEGAGTGGRAEGTNVLSFQHRRLTKWRINGRRNIAASLGFGPKYKS